MRACGCRSGDHRPDHCTQVAQGAQPEGEAHSRRRRWHRGAIGGWSGAFLVHLSTRQRVPRSWTLTGRLRHAPLLPASLWKALLLLWFVVEDHDTLFILSESVHFLGIGLLAYKLIKKRAAGGASGGRAAAASRRTAWLHLPALRRCLLQGRTLHQSSIGLGVNRRACCMHTACSARLHSWIRPRRPVAAHAGADGCLPGGAPVLLLHDGVRHPHPAGPAHPAGHWLGHLLAARPAARVVPGASRLCRARHLPARQSRSRDARLQHCCRCQLCAG